MANIGVLLMVMSAVCFATVKCQFSALESEFKQFIGGTTNPGQNSALEELPRKFRQLEAKFNELKGKFVQQSQPDGTSLDNPEETAVKKFVSEAIKQITRDERPVEPTLIWQKFVEMGTLVKLEPKGNVYHWVFKTILFQIQNYVEPLKLLDFTKQALPQIDQRMGAEFVVLLLKSASKRYGELDADYDHGQKTRMAYFLNYLKNNLEKHLSESFKTTMNQLAKSNTLKELLERPVCIKEFKTGKYILGLSDLSIGLNPNDSAPGVSWRLESQDNGRTFKIKNVQHANYLSSEEAIHIKGNDAFRKVVLTDEQTNGVNWKVDCDPKTNNRCDFVEPKTDENSFKRPGDEILVESDGEVMTVMPWNLEKTWLVLPCAGDL